MKASLTGLVVNGAKRVAWSERLAGINHHVTCKENFSQSNNPKVERSCSSAEELSHRNWSHGNADDVVSAGAVDEAIHTEDGKMVILDVEPFLSLSAICQKMKMLMQKGIKLTQSLPPPPPLGSFESQPHRE